MLMISTTAAEAIESILAADENTGSEAGVRITRQPAAEGVSLALGIAREPQSGDQVVQEEGARVFLAPDAADLLDDKVLDTHVQGTRVSFQILEQT